MRVAPRASFWVCSTSAGFLDANAALSAHMAVWPHCTCPMDACCRYGDSAALGRLLLRGCPVDAADYDGRTLLHVAVTNKQQVGGLHAARSQPCKRASRARASDLLQLICRHQVSRPREVLQDWQARPCIRSIDSQVHPLLMHPAYASDAEYWPDTL